MDPAAGAPPDSFRTQHEAVRREFRLQAEAWGRDPVDDDLRWAVERLGLPPESVVIDVAAGTGLLARAIAPRASRVVALDLTAEMLAQGRDAAQRSGIENVRFEEGEAERLPYAEESFDAAVTRFSFHHLPDPRAAAREMARVCRRGGIVGVIDIVAPEDAVLAARYNRLERLRDPSHARALSPAELRGTLEGAGLRVVGEFRRDVGNDLDDWLLRTRTPDAARAEILAALRGELAGGAATGMRPFVKDGRLGFLHDWDVVVGVSLRG